MKYETYNLSDWPFRTAADEDFAPVWAGRPKTKEQLERLLLRWEKIPASGLHILWANFGMGKTHTLYHLKYKCFKTAGKLIPIYCVMPRRSTGFLELYREIIQAMDFDFLGRQLIDFGNVNKGGIATHPFFQRSPGVVNALLALRSGDIEAVTTSRQWLAAQPGLSKHEMNLINVSYRIKTPEDAINALTVLTKLALYGHPDRQMIIMIDEYQRVGELNRRVANENNSSLHTFFNCQPTGLQLILSFSFGVRENVDFLLSPELKSRASPQAINLDVLSQADAASFIQDLLSQFRLRPESCWSFPFSPDTVSRIISYIASRKKLTPRRLMLYFNHILGEYLLEDIPVGGMIEFDQARKYLEESNLGEIDLDIQQ